MHDEMNKIYMHEVKMSGWVGAKFWERDEFANSNVAGNIKVDGVTAVVDATGVLKIMGGGGSSSYASTAAHGVVRPDNSTITIDDQGVISAFTHSIAGAGSVGVVKGGGNSINIETDGSVQLDQTVNCTFVIAGSTNHKMMIHGEHSVYGYNAILNVGTPEATPGNFVVGQPYTITNNTDGNGQSPNFTNIGAVDNNVGTSFVATGTGDAAQDLGRASEDNNSGMGHGIGFKYDDVHQGGSGAAHMIPLDWDGQEMGTVSSTRDVYLGDLNGGYTAVYSWNGVANPSDYRLKQNVQYDFDALSIVDQMKPCKFDWNVRNMGAGAIGFLAHELQAAVPRAVEGQKDAMKNGKMLPQHIKEHELIGLAFKAIKELRAKVAALEARNP